jgi:cysteine desulfurase/selenocysteine lyase
MVYDVSADGFERNRGYEGFEAGTPNISGGIGLGAAVDYLKGVGMDEIKDHEARLMRRMLCGLEAIDGIEIYGPRDPMERGALMSFNVKGLDPHEVALMLEESSSILVRSGHHCCIPLMRYLGLKHGTVRASTYLYNSDEEIEKFLATMEEIAKVA